MTLDIALTLGILLIAIVLFATEIFRADLTGLLVLVILAISGLVTFEESISGFSNPAVITTWAVFILSAGLSRTGVAARLAGQVIRLAGIMIMTMLLNQFIPSAVNAVVMTPIAIATAAGLAVSPYHFVMGIAYSVAASFMTPVSHPVNILIMSPGGYRFGDYIRNGLPFLLIVLFVCILLLPVVFPY